MGEALGVSVCDIVSAGKTVGCDVNNGCGELRSDEHDKRENAKGMVNRKTLVCTCKRLLIKLLLTDRIPQHSQSFDFNNDFISVL